ncbi:phosphatase PAP2 family protein [Tenacibaculum sp. UWU-22]|uniref:phosphatase PAP2 family protein n=1 Tax=Tenacibaculum sp. UWU-22 TaxID=3234187 RepID=UPI0034DB410D
MILAVLIAASDQLSQLFKFSFKRLRPCYNEDISGVVRLVKTSCGGKYSYFSAHASTSAALAVYIGLIFKSTYKQLLYILLFFTFLVGYSRIYIGVHYPLDVITGFCLGGFLGYLFYQLFKKVLTAFYPS